MSVLNFFKSCKLKAYLEFFREKYPVTQVVFTTHRDQPEILRRFIDGEGNLVLNLAKGVVSKLMVNDEHVSFSALINDEHFNFKLNMEWVLGVRNPENAYLHLVGADAVLVPGHGVAVIELSNTDPNSHPAFNSPTTPTKPTIH